MTTERLQIYTWEAGDGVIRRYCINTALQLIAELDIPALPLVTPALVRQVLQYNNRIGELRQEDIDAADLTKPIIHMLRDTPEGPRHIVIDGWHRLSKAAKINHPFPLCCYVLPQDVAELCRI